MFWILNTMYFESIGLQCALMLAGSYGITSAISISSALVVAELPNAPALVAAELPKKI